MYGDSRGRFMLLPVVLFGVYGVYYYFSHRQTVPLTGRKHMVDMTPQQEAALGFQSYRQILAKSRDHGLQHVGYLAFFSLAIRGKYQIELGVEVSLVLAR